MIGYRVVTKVLPLHRAVSVRRACERSSVGHFIVLIFLAMRFYSTISLFHDMPTISAVDRHYAVADPGFS